MPDLGQLPSAVRERAILTTLGPAPALVVLPESPSSPPPVLLWLHGRQANKEIDPGRALRLLRAGIGFIGVDLPGHGERAEASYQSVEGTLQTILEMSQELDDVHAAVVSELPVDPEQIAIGGMSAGGMAAAHRLVTPHPYRAMLMEASTGNWAAQAHRPCSNPFARSVASPRPHGVWPLGPPSQCWPNTAVWTNGFDLKDNVSFWRRCDATQVTP